MVLTALRELSLRGGDWVLYLLLLCSVISVAAMLEKWWVLSRERNSLDRFSARLSKALSQGKLQEAEEVLGRLPAGWARMVLSALEGAGRGASVAEEYFWAGQVTERKKLESHLLILGTLGNSAPFIGLFGTVLGIIKAFHDLARTGTGNPAIVMKGLSEALIATAAGLMVAIPAVIAYNYFQKRVQDILTDTEALSRLFIANLKR